MKNLALTILLATCGFFGIAQDHQKDFENYRAANDSIAQLEVLSKWEKENPNDAELYTSYLNFYFTEATKEVVAIEPEPSSKESLEIYDSINNIKAYINNKIIYDDAFINKGFEYINIGIKKFPNRLDMRFGKIHVYSKINYWQDYTNEILKAIDHSHEINNLWTWTNNEKPDSAEEFFLNTVQDYVVQLYKLNDDKLIPLMRSISEKVLLYYPNNIKNLSNLAATYLLGGENDKAIELLLRVENINPKDFIVLSNIAHGYKLKGEIEKSIEYYEKTIEHGDSTHVAPNCNRQGIGTVSRGFSQRPSARCNLWGAV